MMTTIPSPGWRPRGLQQIGSTYYLDQAKGSPTNKGLSPTSAFNDGKTAIKALKPGDSLEIIGTLANPSYVRGYTFKNVSDPQMWHGENTFTISNVRGLDLLTVWDA
jgi:hypothetical protein